MNPGFNSEVRPSNSTTFEYLTTKRIAAIGKLRGFEEPVKIELIDDADGSVLYYFIGEQLDQDKSFPVLICKATEGVNDWYTTFVKAEDATEEEDIIRQAAQTATKLDNPHQEIGSFLNLCQYFDTWELSRAVIRTFSTRGDDDYGEYDAWGVVFGEEDSPADLTAAS